MTDRDRHRLGETIGGRYRVISLLGEGGHGVTYRAWDNAAGVPVVLKMPLAKHLVRPVVIERFEREVVRLRECNHPHIVPIIDDGLDGDGRPYLVMRFLPGGSLADRRRPVGPASLHNWLPAIASALDYTHSLGVLHRDVKPANIFFDTQARAYLGDFGIAKLAEEHDDASNATPLPKLNVRDTEESLTRTGGLIGTSVYIPPEAFEDRPQLGHQADQYSLAVAVYEMLSGAFPMMGTTDVDGGRKRRRGGRVAAVQNGGAQACSSLGGDDRGDSPDHTPFQREAQECTATWRSGARYAVRC